MSSRFDRPDPALSADYTDGLRPAEPDFECLRCGNLESDTTHFPYCDARCAADAAGESREDEDDPRERHDDDGREFGDPRDFREERFDHD